MTYAYNAQGKRMRKTRTNGANAGTDHFVYDEEGRLLGVYDENGNPREEIVWFDGWRPVATIRGSVASPDIYRITSDHLGAPLSVMDDNGVVVWEWDGREPFGFQMPNQDPDGDSNYFYLNMRFAGQWFDYETGLYHNGFRDYHPKAGRYIQSDPIGLEGGWNTYAYTENNPVNFVDPEGLDRISSAISYMDEMVLMVFNEMEAKPLPQPLVNFTAGMGDAASFGLTSYIRNLNGTANHVSADCYYQYGGYAGLGLSIFSAGGAGTAINMGIKYSSKILNKQFFHYSSKEIAQKIAQDGIKPSKGGLYGSGIYVTPFGKRSAHILGAKNTSARTPVNYPMSQIHPTAIPGNFVVKP